MIVETIDNITEKIVNLYDFDDVATNIIDNFTVITDDNTVPTPDNLDNDYLDWV